MDFREESWMIRYGKRCEKGDIHEIGCFPSFLEEILEQRSYAYGICGKICTGIKRDKDI